MGKFNLPEHWDSIKLSNQQLFSFENGIWKGKKEPFEECAVVRNTNFTSDGYLDLTNVAVLPIEQRHIAKKHLQWGDIVIERSGGGPEQPVGRVVFFDLNDGTYCFSNFTSRLRVIDKDTINPTYLFFYLLYFHDSGQTRKLQKRTTGIRNLIFGDYKESIIPLPPLPEQHAIAYILQTIQEAKFTRQREIALEREHKAALMNHLFSHGTKGEPRKQTEIGEIPESWATTRLTEVVTFTKKPRDLQYSEYDKIPFVPMELIPIAKLSSEEFLLKTNNELKSGTYFEPGDILLPKITPSFENGKQCIIRELPTPFGIATTEVIPIRDIEGVSDISYLFYYLLLPNVRISLAGKMQGTTGRQRLSKDALVNLQIPLPPLTEQRAIATVFQAIDEKTAALEQEAAHLDELFHAVLDELMTGQRSAMPLINTE